MSDPFSYFISKLKHIQSKGCTYFITTCIANRNMIFADCGLAQILMDDIIYGRNEGWYYLFGFVIMPDHLHLELAPRNKAIPAIMKCLKGYSSRQINLKNERTGTLWQEGYMDFPIYSKKIAWQKLVYIEQNPVRAGLVTEAINYPYSSAGMHDLLDLDHLA
jgi:putative transposase